MGRKSSFSKEEKIGACKAYMYGEGSCESIAKNFGIAPTTLVRWLSLYRYHGEHAFETENQNQSYSKEYRLKIVEEFASGNHSALELSGKYKIALSLVHSWISSYNNGVELRSYSTKGAVYTLELRKTSYEERLEIVKWVIENDMNYKEAASNNSVKYSLVYQWVQKYIKSGAEALQHKKRGPKSKNLIDVTGLSEVEKLKLELEREKQLRKQAEFELELLKKKEEFEKKRPTRK